MRRHSTPDKRASQATSSKAHFRVIAAGHHRTARLGPPHHQHSPQGSRGHRWRREPPCGTRARGGTSIGSESATVDSTSSRAHTAPTGPSVTSSTTRTGSGVSQNLYSDDTGTGRPSVFACSGPSRTCSSSQDDPDTPSHSMLQSSETIASMAACGQGVSPQVTAALKVSGDHIHVCLSVGAFGGSAPLASLASQATFDDGSPARKVAGTKSTQPNGMATQSAQITRLYAAIQRIHRAQQLTGEQDCSELPRVGQPVPRACSCQVRPTMSYSMIHGCCATPPCTSPLACLHV
jgi:hypothetical protein